MPHHRIVTTLAAMAAVLALAGCFGSEAQGPKLTGQRIDITMQPSTLQASPSAQQEEFQIPEPQPQPNWPQSGGNAAHAVGNVALPHNVVRAWTYDIGGGNGTTSALINPPVVDAGRLFAINTKGQIYALNAKTGSKLWKVSLPFINKDEESFSGGLAVLGNLLFATTGDGQVFALTASTGKEVWKTALGVPLRGAPTVQGQQVFVISHDNRMFALSALDGALQWTHSGMEEPLSILTAPSVAAANGMVAVPYTSGEIYVLRDTDGRYIWHDTLTSAFTGQDPESQVNAIAAPPVFADGLLYVQGVNGGLSAYNATTGQRYWKNPDILGTQMPVVAGLQMFALTSKGELAALNRRDGSVRWVENLNKGLPEKDAGRRWSGPVLAGGRLIAASSDGYALSLSPEDGKRLAATELGKGVDLPPIVADGALYFLASDGRIICFRAGK